MDTAVRTYKVLIVDDTKTNIDVLVEGLKDSYHLSVAVNGETALKIAEKSPPDLVLLDIMMPGIDGYEVCRRLKGNPALADIPVMFLSALDEVQNKTKGFEVGGSDYLAKPFEMLEVKARVRALLEAKAYRDHMRDYQRILEADIAKATAALREAKRQISLGFLETTLRLALAAEFKDRDTGAHILRIGAFAAAISDAMGLDMDFRNGLLHAAPLHDIGKIGIPDAILLKPGRLTDDEMAVMRKHTVFGARILEGSRSKIINLGRIVALSHHERWDGKGYPNGLKGEQIPLSGRIIAVADVFDALTSKRCYKEASTIAEAFETIEHGSGSLFDPNVVRPFLNIRGKIEAIRNDLVASDHNLLSEYLGRLLRGEVDEALMLEEPTM